MGVRERLRWIGVPLLCAVALSACGNNDENNEGGSSSAASGTLYDLTGLINKQSEEEAAYRPKVDQLTLSSFALTVPNGKNLMLNGVFTAEAEIEVDGEPFKSALAFGLVSMDGAHCQLGAIDASHLDLYYDAADRAMAAASAAASSAGPSLASCKRGEKCAAEGEECIGFLEAVAIAGEGDIDTTMEPEASDKPDNPPREVWQCMTTDYALRTVAERASAPRTISPADLAGGGQKGTYLLKKVTSVPPTCADLVGKSDLKVWVAFDPKAHTEFALRPDSATVQGMTSDGMGMDEAHMSTDPYDHRVEDFTQTTALGLVDKQELSLDLIDINTTGSLIEYDEKPHDTTDVTLNVKIAVSGLEEEEEVTVGTSPLAFIGKMRPVGTLDNCTPGGTPGADTEEVAFVVGQNMDGTPIVEDVFGGLVGDAQAVISREIDVHFTDAARDRILTGDWSCAKGFQVELCMQTLFPITEDSPDCRAVSFEIVRTKSDVLPPQMGTGDAGSAPGGQGQLKAFQNGCDKNLLDEYQGWMKKKQEAEDLAQVHKYYIMDFYKYWESSFYKEPQNVNTGAWREALTNYHTRHNTWKRIRNCIAETTKIRPNAGRPAWEKVSDCAGHLGGLPISRSSFEYVRDYVWRDFVRFRGDPIGWTKSQMSGQCGRLNDGYVCGYINNDPNRVNELKDKILDIERRNDASNGWLRYISSRGELHRCLSPLRALTRVEYPLNAQANQVYREIGEDGAFYTKFLTNRCAASHFEQKRREVWNRIQSKCAAPHNDYQSNPGGYGSHRRLVPEWVKQINSGEKHGLEIKFRAGLINDSYTRRISGRGWNDAHHKFIFGPEVKLWLDNYHSGWKSIFRLHDIYRWNMQAEFYADNGGSTAKTSWIDAGQHVLLRDIYRIRFPMPLTTAVEWPEPPGFSKEKEKCQYLRPGASPVSLELCAAISAAAEVGVGVKIPNHGVKASNEGDRSTWPGVEGAVTPKAGVTATARVGVDFIAGSVGLKLDLGIYTISLPFTIGMRWTMSTDNNNRLSYKISPYLSLDLEESTLDGTISMYLRFKFPEKEYAQALYEWDGFKKSRNIFSWSRTYSGTK